MTVNLTDPIFNDEDKARAYFEEIRWPNGVTCTHCGNANSARIYSIAANPAKKIRAGMTTFIRANRNRMIESFQNFIGVGRKRLFDQLNH